MSGVTIHDMETIATSLPDISYSHQQDQGTVIDLNDFGGDDIGLLMNPKFMTQNPTNNNNQNQTQQNQQFPQSTTINISPLPQTSGLSEVDITNLEPIRLGGGSGSGGNDFSIPAVNDNMNHDASFNGGGGGGGGNPYFNSQSSTTSPQVNLTPAPPKDHVAESKKKIEYINKLARLAKKGYPVSRTYTMDNTLEEMETEYTRLVDARNLELSTKMQRKMLMGFVSGVEWMNNKFDPFDVELDGWSESVHENIDEYDDIFEELYDKYKERGQMAPELKLLFAIGGSGFMFHVSKKFYQSKVGAGGGSMEELFRQNPELAKQFAAAAAAQAGPGFGKFIGATVGVQQAPAPYSNPNVADPGPGAFFGSPQNIAAREPPPVQRREMRGPTGVDDILRTFEEVRQAEQQANQNNAFPPPSSSSAMMSEIQSVHSGGGGGDDQGSVATGKTGGRRQGGGRRRAPVENVVEMYA